MGRHAGQVAPLGDVADGRLRVDPTRCVGTGMCAHLAPRIVTLDSWGYPILVGESAVPHAARDADAAIAACPRQALFLEGARQATDAVGSAPAGSHGRGPQAVQSAGSRPRRRRGRYR